MWRDFICLFESKHMQIIFDHDPIAAAILLELISKRPVRPVVTPSGRRARGVQPAKRALGPARYESLNEQRFWQSFDNSRRVQIFCTHPFVLRLADGGKPFHYTPDSILIDKQTGLVIFEAKAEYFLSQKKTRVRLLHIANALKSAGLRFAVGLDSDHADMHALLDQIQAARPIGRLPTGTNVTAWDPIMATAPPAEIRDAWKEAKAQCDALIEKAMKRGADPSAFLTC
jgi:hypothetical protein